MPWYPGPFFHSPFFIRWPLFIRDKIFSRLLDGACFVAGTLVWTDRGLRPIEEIQVGDLVLSKPENDDNAPTAYKRVTHTSSREADVGFLEVYRENPESVVGIDMVGLVVTYEHPFWCSNNFKKQSWSWQAMNRVGDREQIRLQDGTNARS